MKIALVQMEIKERNCAGNTAHGLMLLEEAARQSDLVVLPEIWTTGYSLGHLKEEAVTRIYNMIPAISKKGDLVYEYGKAHLFGMFEEEKFFAPGESFNAFDLDGVCCGATICYDLRFPEFYRYLALQGARLIVCPAEWPTRRGDGFDLLSRARAFENHVYVAAVNCVGSFKGDPFYGHSRIIDPMNHIVAEGGDKEEIIYADIDLDMVTKVRKNLNALTDVRFKIMKPGE